MKLINKEIKKLNETDTYSLILFALFKLREIPEYSSLSELPYILDKENLLKFCEYYGGLTIKVPTVDELESLVYSLILHQYVNVDGIPYDEAVDIIGHKSKHLRKVKSDYEKIVSVLEDYDFQRSTKQ